MGSGMIRLGTILTKYLTVPIMFIAIIYILIKVFKNK